MATDQGTDTSRTTVKTYVPAYQKEAWAIHADELDMSQSEFVRTMVQAGRREFGVPDVPDDAAPAEAAGETGDDQAAPTDGAAEPLRDRVLAVLDADTYLEWDDLVDALHEDLEDRLEAVLDDLQADNDVRYSGRNGGYTLLSEDG